MAIGIALSMTFLRDEVVKLIYGEAYEKAGKVLMIHIWTLVFVFLGVAFSHYLLSENLTKVSFYRTFLGAVLNVLLNFLWIPKYGIMGVVVATLVTQFAVNYAYDIFDKQLYNQLKLKTLSIIYPLAIINIKVQRRR
jgi:O-antigen/teichoic acid export membrane protein